MKKVFDRDIFADFYQFYVYDAKVDPLDELPDPTPASAKRCVRRGYEQTDSALQLITRAHLHCHWIEVYLADRVPRFKQRHNTKLALRFSLQGNTLFIGGASEYETRYRCRIPKGDYRLYVYGYCLGVDPPPPKSDRKRERVGHDCEGYRLVFVPVKRSTGPSRKRSRTP